MATAVKERSVIVRDWEARAWAAGRLGLIVRPVKMVQFHPSDTPGYDWIFRRRPGGTWEDYRTADLVASKWNPLGPPGTPIWGREAHRSSSIKTEFGISRAVEYLADGVSLEHPRDRVLSLRQMATLSAATMPRWASRLHATVEAVRVQRVQEITHEEAIAAGCQGCNWVASSPYISGPHTDDGELPTEEFEREFRERWEREHPWASNPWVWLYEIKDGARACALEGTR